MTFLTKDFERVTFGVIVGNRDVFTDHLTEEGRKEIISVLKDLRHKHIILKVLLLIRREHGYMNQNLL